MKLALRLAFVAVVSSVLLAPQAIADPTVTSVDRGLYVGCISDGDSGIQLFENPISTDQGAFNHSFDLDCADTCTLPVGIPDEGTHSFICNSQGGQTSTTGPWRYEAQGHTDHERTEYPLPCYGACGVGGNSNYEVRFDTDADYRMVFTGSSSSARIWLHRTIAPGGYPVWRDEFESGPIFYDGIQAAGSFHLLAITGADQIGSFDFTLTISAPPSPGPPPVPDGASVPGVPLTASKVGNAVGLSWEPTACSGGQVNIYRGAIGDYSTFTAGDCALPSTGTATVSMPDNSWFLVVNTDGAGTDGSWSRNPQGTELSYFGASSVCPAIMLHQPDGVCP